MVDETLDYVDVKKAYHRPCSSAAGAIVAGELIEEAGMNEIQGADS